MQSLLLVIFPALMAFAGCSDLLTMRISNKLVLAVIIAFFVLAFVAGMAFPTMGMAIVAALVVLAVTFTCFAFGWIGGGDAKFAAATVLWFGWTMQTLQFLVFASALGGLLTIAFLIFRRTPIPDSWRKIEWIERLYNSKNGVPYGIALAAAAMLVFPETEIFKSLASAGH